MGFRVLVSRHPAIQTTGLLTLAPAGLSPAEHTSLHWTHNQTRRSLASGSPTGFIARHTTGQLAAGVRGAGARVLAKVGAARWHSAACAIDAYQRDLNVIIPREAVGSYDRDHEATSLRYMNRKIASASSVPELISSLTNELRAIC
jgi:hypothetical protein